MNKLLYSFLLLILFISPVSTATMRIAVMDFKPRGVSRSLANNISELIRGEIINFGKYIVIERDQMGKILDEQGIQQAGCTDVSCAVEVGKILTANKILVGSVMKLGGQYIITGRIVDVEKAVGEFSESQNAESEKHIYSAVKLFTKKLAARIDNRILPNLEYGKFKCIDGNCTNGKGIAIYKGKTSDGDPFKFRFEGKFRNSNFNGKGIYICEYNSSKYRGKWKNGKFSGRGVYTIRIHRKSKNVEYKGEWDKGCLKSGGLLSLVYKRKQFCVDIYKPEKK